MGQKEESSVPMLGFKALPTRVTAGHAVEEKGENEDAIEKLQTDIEKTGIRRAIFKSDNEPALVKVVEEVGRLRRG